MQGKLQLYNRELSIQKPVWWPTLAPKLPRNTQDASGELSRPTSEEIWDGTFLGSQSHFACLSKYSQPRVFGLYGAHNFYFGRRAFILRTDDFHRLLLAVLSEHSQIPTFCFPNLDFLIFPLFFLANLHMPPCGVC